MDDKKIFTVIGIVAGIMLLFAIFSPRGGDTDIADLVAEQMAPLSDTVAELGGRIDEVEASLGGITEQLGAAASAEDLAAISAQVEETLAQTGSLSESLDAMQSELASGLEAMAAAPAAAQAQAAAPTETEDSTASAAEETSATATAANSADASAQSDGSSLSVGQTALFADGALRVFVSRVDEAANEVRVSVAGASKTLTVGQGRTLPVGDDFCRLTVSGVAGNSAAIDAVCGDELPAPEGISAGETALLADGALRVFASRVMEDAARLNINGEMHELAVGRSAAAMAGDEQCRVQLDGVDRGHASVSAICGDAVAVSEMTGPGSTVVLGDGAARVFVGSVTEDAVRYSVNGQTLVTGASGDSQDVAEGCAVTVEDIADRKASFSYACDG